jgi:hypothetical protein
LFATSFISPGGSYTICAYTSLLGDGDHMNDTTCKNIIVMPTFNLPYSDDFEGTNYWLSADGNAQWEFGVPASSVINTAHSPVNAWKTKLAGNYVSNMDDNLYTPVFNLSPLMDTVTFSFWHWYNTEANADGGTIQYTLNSGVSWVTLGSVGDPLGANWYNSNISGKASWSGNSTGWVQSTYKIPKTATYSNFNLPIQFRFNFFSNAATEFNGWAVDDFAFTTPLIAFDAGVISIDQPAVSTPMYSSIAVSVTIKNFGLNTISNIPVSFAINGNTPVAETFTGSILPGVTAVYAFTTNYASPATTYNICAYTDLSADTHSYNDTTCNSIIATTAMIDAGITKIVLPIGPVTIYGVNTTVAATIKNYGAGTLTSVPVEYNIDGGAPISEVWNGTLLPGDSIDYTFTNTYLPPYNPIYILCVNTNLPNDLITSNDSSCEQFDINVGIEEEGNDGLYLGQNIPNPANNQTTIGYFVPENGKAVFTVMNSVGQIIYTEADNIVAGEHQLKLDIGAWSSGIYFYTLNFNGSKLYRKMIISR